MSLKRIAALLAIGLAAGLPALAQDGAVVTPPSQAELEAAIAAREAAREAYVGEAGGLAAEDAAAIARIEAAYWEEVRRAEQAYGRDLAVGGAFEASDSYAERMRALDERFEADLREADEAYFENVWSERPTAID